MKMNGIHCNHCKDLMTFAFKLLKVNHYGCRVAILLLSLDRLEQLAQHYLDINSGCVKCPPQNCGLDMMET